MELKTDKQFKKNYPPKVTTRSLDLFKKKKGEKT